ncbi:MAG: HlyD family efflux transporter periplasmic adaptor subunit [Bacillota bacterium]
MIKAWLQAVTRAAVIAGILLLSGCATEDAELTANGTVEATEIKVVAEVGGQLKELRVKEGDRVKAGQLIGNLDDEPYRIQVEQARASTSGAGATLSEAESGARSQEIDAARQEVDRLSAQVAAAREQLALQEDSLQRAESLFGAEALPEQELVARQSQVRVARHQLEAAEAQLEAARARLALLKAGSRPQTIDRLAAGVKQAQGGLALAELNLQKTKLIAPAAGVVSSLNFEKGELIRPGAEVATLLDDRKLWLNVYVPENDLGQVRVGQNVHVAVDTYPGRTFPGKVVYIAPEAEFTPRNVQTKKDRVNLVFRVKVEVTGGQGDLRPGLPADVTF